jgi:predicted  nucleic acid-binding Zn-ribbon protein
MKYLPSLVLGLLCAGLAAALFVTKRNNDSQLEKDAQVITGTSNLLASCQTEFADLKGKAIILSNRLQACHSTSLTFSNELMEARSVLATTKEGLDRQITDLNQQISQERTQSETEKQASMQRFANLTNQIAELTNQIASAKASLLEANKDYALLENRFRRDVAERILVERKFNNRAELKAQLEHLLKKPSMEISEDRIREGLNVVVGRSNLWYVIAPEGSLLP